MALNVSIAQQSVAAATAIVTGRKPASAATVATKAAHAAVKPYSKRVRSNGTGGSQPRKTDEVDSKPDRSDALVLFMPSGKRGPLSGRHAGAGCRAPARRLCRERLRRPRHLRALPDRGAGRQFRQAQDRLLQRPHLADRPEGRALRPRARPARRRRLSCSAQILGDLVIDVPQDTVINAPGRPQGRRRPRHRAQCRRSSCAMSRSKSPTCTSRSAISTG